VTGITTDQPAFGEARFKIEHFTEFHFGCGGWILGFEVNFSRAFADVGIGFKPALLASSMSEAPITVVATMAEITRAFMKDPF
jgi:hypothetical protein